MGQIMLTSSHHQPAPTHPRLNCSPASNRTNTTSSASSSGDADPASAATAQRSLAPPSPHEHADPQRRGNRRRPRFALRFGPPGPGTRDARRGRGTRRAGAAVHQREDHGCASRGDEDGCKGAVSRVSIFCLPTFARPRELPLALGFFSRVIGDYNPWGDQARART